MRRNITTTPTGNEDNTLCRILSPALNKLPPEFRLDACRDADVTATKALLAALKNAVESYLGRNICFAALTLDDLEGNKANVSQEALQALGLRQVLPTIPVAQSAVSAHKPKNFPGFDEEPWIVLAVEYSSHWFKIGLYTIDECFVLPIESFVGSPIIGEDNQLDALGDALRHLFANPPENVTLSNQVHHLVVYGDDEKADVLSLLKTIVGADLVANAIVSNSVFDSVNMIAHTVHEVMGSPYFERSNPSAFGCQWRSALYRTYRDELRWWWESMLVFLSGSGTVKWSKEGGVAFTL